MRIGTAQESYRIDEALFDTATQRLWVGLLAFTLVVYPFLANDYWLYLACLVAIHVASATGLNILTGYTGLVSLGQAAFMGLGAYTVAVLEARFGTPFFINLVAAGVVAMLGGMVVGIPSLRVKGLYLAIVTIAASFLAHFLFANSGFTGGTGGMTVPPASFLGMALDTSFRIYWMIMPLTVLMSWVRQICFAPASAVLSSPFEIAISLQKCSAFRCCDTSCSLLGFLRFMPGWQVACGPISFGWSHRRAFP